LVGCRVVDQELHRVAAAPAVATQMTGDMDRGSARLGEKLAERCPGGPECDRPQPICIQGIGKHAAQMIACHDFGVDNPHTGESKARLRIAGAERRQLLDMADQLRPSRTESERRIDPQFGHQPLEIEPVAQPPDQKLSQHVEVFGGDREPGCHRMPAAIDQQAGLPRRDHRRAERQAGDRAAGAPTDAVVECYYASRPLIAFLETRRDDPDHPGMPIIRRCEDQHR